MGRAMPEARLSSSVQKEVVLARAVEEVVARVAPAQRSAASDAETAALVEQVLAQLDDAANRADESGPSGPRALGRIKLPLVFLDGLEVTQEVQDLAHSVPLVAGKPTIVRAYLRYAPAPVELRGELRLARSANGPWRTVASLGTARLDPSRTGGSLAELRSRRADLGSASTSPYRTTSRPRVRSGCGWDHSDVRPARHCHRWLGCRSARSASGRRRRCGCGLSGCGTPRAPRR